MARESELKLNRLSACAAGLLALAFAVVLACALPSAAFADEEEGVFEELSLSATGAWNACGTCLWSIDSNGLLTIKPANGISGTLDGWNDYGAPWYSVRQSIRSVKVLAGVSAQTCSIMFKNPALQCVGLKLPSLVRASV